MKLIGFVFMKSGGHNTHFGEVRYRWETDTPLSDESVFEPGWQRAEWLDSPVEYKDYPNYPICDSEHPCVVCRSGTNTK